MTKRAFLLLPCVAIATILPLCGVVLTEARPLWPLSTVLYTAGLLGVVVCLAKGRLRPLVFALATIGSWRTRPDSVDMLVDVYVLHGSGNP